MGLHCIVFSGWFVTTQALMTLNVVLTLVSCFLLLLVVIGCFPTKARKLVVCCIGLSQYTIGKYTYPSSKVAKDQGPLFKTNDVVS